TGARSAPASSSWLSGVAHPAEARRLDLDVGPGQRRLELRLDAGRFRAPPEPHEALVIAVQAPDVVRVLAGARQRGIEPEVSGIDGGGLLDVPLFEQQRAVRVPGGLHPAP